MRKYLRAAVSCGRGSRAVSTALHADFGAGYGGIDADASSDSVGDGPGGGHEAVAGVPGAPLGVG